MFPLTPSEAVFFDQLNRYFPDWCEVTETTGGTDMPKAADAGDSAHAQPVVSVTSHQSPLFDNTREEAA